MIEKKYTKILQKIEKGEQFGNKLVSYYQIKDKKVAYYIRNRKWVNKDVIGRLTITEKGKEYLHNIHAKRTWSTIMQLKRIQSIIEYPNKTSKFYRDLWQTTDVGFHMFISSHKNDIIKSGTRSKYTYAFKESFIKKYQEESQQSHSKPHPIKRKGKENKQK